MRMMHIYKSNKYRSVIFLKKQRNDRKMKIVKFFFFVKYIYITHVQNERNVQNEHLIIKKYYFDRFIQQKRNEAEL